MKKIKKKVKAYVAIILLSAGIIASLVIVTPNLKKHHQADVAATPVTIMEIHPSEYSFPIHSEGFLESSDVFILKSQASGAIVFKNKHFYEGSQVQKNDKLFVIDPHPYEDLERIAQSDYRISLIQYQKALAKHKIFLKDWQSFLQLTEGKKENKTIKNKKDWEFELARASLKRTHAAWKKAQLDLEHTVIRAPYTGIATDVVVHVGDFINIGEPLMKFHGIKKASISLMLSPADAKAIRHKKQVKAQVGRFGSRLLMPASVVEVASALKDGFVPVTLEVPYAYGWQPGDFMSVVIHKPPISGLVRLNSNVLINGSVPLFHEGKLLLKPVHVLFEDDHFSYVRGAFEPYEKIITTPLFAPKVGMKLVVVDQHGQ